MLYQHTSDSRIRLGNNRSRVMFVASRIKIRDYKRPFVVWILPPVGLVHFLLLLSNRHVEHKDKGLGWTVCLQVFLGSRRQWDGVFWMLSFLSNGNSTFPSFVCHWRKELSSRKTKGAIYIFPCLVQRRATPVLSYHGEEKITPDIEV